MDAKFFDPTRAEDDFQIRIDKNGQWYHQGSPITRDRLTKLFSTALHYDADKNEYWLITPHEQGRVDVEDIAFIIIKYNYNNKNNELKLFSNLDYEIKPDQQNPIFIKGDLPHVVVTNGCPALLNRVVREDLINIALEQGGYDDATKTLYLKANGHDHTIARS